MICAAPLIYGEIHGQATDTWALDCGSGEVRWQHQGGGHCCGLASDGSNCFVQSTAIGDFENSASALSCVDAHAGKTIGLLNTTFVYFYQCWLMNMFAPFPWFHSIVTPTPVTLLRCSFRPTEGTQTMPLPPSLRETLVMFTRTPYLQNFC